MKFNMRMLLQSRSYVMWDGMNVKQLLNLLLVIALAEKDNIWIPIIGNRYIYPNANRTVQSMGIALCIS